MESVYEYLDRIEKASLEILEAKQPISQVITLWCGFDGLRLNEDGTMEWVSRKKKKPSVTTFYQPCQNIQPLQTGSLRWPVGGDTTQCTQAQIDALMAQNAALQIQSRQETLVLRASSGALSCNVSTVLLRRLL